MIKTFTYITSWLLFRYLFVTRTEGTPPLHINKAWWLQPWRALQRGCTKVLPALTCTSTPVLCFPIIVEPFSIFSTTIEAFPSHWELVMWSCLNVFIDISMMIRDGDKFPNKTGPYSLMLIKKWLGEQQSNPITIQKVLTKAKQGAQKGHEGAQNVHE